MSSAHRRRMRRSRPGRATAGSRKASSRVLFADHDEDESEQAKHGGNAAGADEVHRGTAVAAGGRIVVVAEEQDGVGGGADFSGRGFDEREAEVARLVFETVEVAGDAALWRNGEQDGSVRELVDFDVVRVFESGG